MTNIGGLYISTALHKSFIELNESGVEAAAVTFFGGTIGESPDLSRAVKFHVNKPFVFSICEKSTGSILFIGKIDKIK
jgi:serpin B